MKNNSDAFDLGLYAMKWFYVWRFFLVGSEHDQTRQLTWSLHYMSASQYAEFIEGNRK